MIRLFEQHKIRPQKELDGLWKATVNGETLNLPVPGCWEQHPKLLTYRGDAVYTKTINVDKQANIRLEFKGVSHTADVYWDGEKIAHHYNAFTGFSAVLPDVKSGEHSLKVEVSNAFSEASALHVPNDYYTYGGITRPVVLEEISNAYIKEIHFTPACKDSVWQGEISVTLSNLAPKAFSGTLNINLGKNTIKQSVSIAASSDATINLLMKFEDVDAWTPENPALYLLSSCLIDENNVPIDDYIERVGFREVSINGRNFMLNGKRVFLKGFNRHEDYGTIGCSIPFQLMVQDIEMMKEIGSNAIRTCHYPNDERFLDLCDETGMMVWEENHARGFDLAKMTNPNFDKQCEDCINEMIKQHYNHPSIVIWGILNECASETEIGREKYKKQYEQIKSLDTSRPTTSATCRHFTDICLDLPDIASFNIYSGWYQDVSVAEMHKKEMAWIDEAAGKEKPIIVSEFGGAAMYGFRDRGHCKWSEERQADIIRENLEVYKDDDRLAGTFIWQFADCKVTEEEWFPTRVRCHNNKGVVDEYRRPKMAYDVVSEYFPKMTRE